MLGVRLQLGLYSRGMRAYHFLFGPQTRRGGPRARARFERGRQDDPVLLVAERGHQARALVSQLLHRQRGRRLQHLRYPNLSGSARAGGWAVGGYWSRVWLVVGQGYVK